MARIPAYRITEAQWLAIIAAGTQVPNAIYFVEINTWLTRLYETDNAGTPNPRIVGGNAHKGAYAGGTTYLFGDLVRHNGVAWFCKVASSTGNAPPTLPTTSNTQWELLTQKGDPGTGFIVGEGEPSSGAGNDGDSYMDTLTGSFYEKTAGVWAETAGQAFASAVADAEQARDDAQDHADDAAASATEAEGHADNAYTYSQDAASAVAYQDLASIAETKAVTAVDVFVYDTSKDSDGGAWRHRCQHTSWYNETLNTATRGSRKEFPAVAVIVAEASKITIYDGDDPELPMWRVFVPVANSSSGTEVWRPTRNASSIFALNGILAWGQDDSASTGNGMSFINLVADSAGRYHTDTSISGQGSPLVGMDTPDALILDGSLGVIVQTVVNDVAMTVLPDAPVDPATGLPIPTIAVATDGGVSVIKDDGDIWDIGTGSAFTVVSFDGQRLWISSDYTVSVGPIPTADITLASWRDWYGQNTAGDLPYYGNLIVGTDKQALASSGKLVQYYEDLTDISGSLLAYTTSSYNTGWMPGDIKGAFLSDTDDTDLVGSGELVTNGGFATDSDWTKGTGWSVSGGVATHSQAAGGGALSQILSLVVGKTYVISANIDTTGDVTISNSSLGIRNAAGTYDIATIPLLPNASKVYMVTFVATETNSQVWVYSADDIVSVDNVSVKLADADRSVNNNGLIINGTVTKTAVA